MKNMYQLSTEQVLAQMQSTTGGLSAEEANQRKKTFGWNELESSGHKTAIRIFLEQFQDFLVLILIVAAVISGLLGNLESTCVILIVLTLNAVLGTLQNYQAERSLISLKNLAGPETTVLRDNTATRLSARELVPGDIIFLEAGDAIPADGRILESASLKINESALTGESISIEKNTDIILEEVSLADRKNMVFAGSFVTYGRGCAVITGIGMQTEIGKIASLLQNTSEKKTPLQVSLDIFGKKLSLLILIICAGLFTVSVFRGTSIGNAFLFAVALAVAAIPEALSSIVTIVLSFGTRKMAKEHAIIRKLQAVEGLGSISIICSDKTGTLTQNKMTVTSYYVNDQQIPVNNLKITDTSHKLLYFASVLCNDAKITLKAEPLHACDQPASVNDVSPGSPRQEEIGDPTELALLQTHMQLEQPYDAIQKQYPRIAELPFDSERKLMSTLHSVNAPFKDAKILTGGISKHLMIVKGAVDAILRQTDSIWKGNEIISCTDVELRKIQEQNQILSEQGLRVLAFAYKELPAEEKLTSESEAHLTFLGLIAMTDPPRPESKEAIETCKKAGIRPIMITGDHILTASAIAEQLGIFTEETLACEGSVLDTMSDQELLDFVPKISVYARVSPEHKIRIVRAWQTRGNIVAMTGDGVNDAPALKQADIGVAMGITGTEVAKDAAAMVLTDDNFATIVSAVKNGRTLYRNIIHAIQFLLSGNLGAILTVLAASLADLPVPFAPVHLLFINLLTDSLPAITLGLEPASGDVMDEQPRPSEKSFLSREFLSKVALEGAVIGTVTMFSFLCGLNQGDALLASTCSFGTLCLARLFHGFNCKAGKPVIFTHRMFDNKWLIGAFALGTILITLALTCPLLHTVFQVQTLTVPQFGMVYLYAFCSLPVIQLLKWVRSRRHALVKNAEKSSSV